MNKIKINIGNLTNEMIELPENIVFASSQDKPYFAYVLNNNNGFVIRFEYMFDDERKKLLTAEECVVEYGINSGKVYELKCNDLIITNLMRGTKFIFQGIKSEGNMPKRFEANKKVMKQILDQIIPLIIKSLTQMYPKLYQ